MFFGWLFFNLYTIMDLKNFSHYLFLSLIFIGLSFVDGH